MGRRQLVSCPEIKVCFISAYLDSLPLMYVSYQRAITLNGGDPWLGVPHLLFFGLFDPVSYPGAVRTSILSMPRLTSRCLLPFSSFHRLSLRMTIPLQKLLREDVGPITRTGFTSEVMDTLVQSCPGSLPFSRFQITFIDAHLELTPLREFLQRLLIDTHRLAPRVAK